jgi:hypothetical protein
LSSGIALFHKPQEFVGRSKTVAFNFAPDWQWPRVAPLDAVALQRVWLDVRESGKQSTAHQVGHQPASVLMLTSVSLVGRRLESCGAKGARLSGAFQERDCGVAEEEIAG